LTLIDSATLLPTFYKEVVCMKHLSTYSSRDLDVDKLLQDVPRRKRKDVILARTQ